MRARNIIAALGYVAESQRTLPQIVFKKKDLLCRSLFVASPFCGRSRDTINSIIYRERVLPSDVVFQRFLVFMSLTTFLAQKSCLRFQFKEALGLTTIEVTILLEQNQRFKGNTCLNTRPNILYLSQKNFKALTIFLLAYSLVYL